LLTSWATLSRGEPALAQTITFRPEPDTSYRPPCTQEQTAVPAAPYEGQDYTLEIVAPRETPTEQIPARIEVQLVKQAQSGIYLPIISKP
jgi:hypothetical protein